MMFYKIGWKGRMSDILRFRRPNVPVDRNALELKGDADIMLASETVRIYEHELRYRPELLADLHIPELIAKYLGLHWLSRRKLGEFRARNPRYLIGEGDGYAVRSLDDVCYDTTGLQDTRGISWSLGRLARKTRWSHQLMKIFALYLEQGRGSIFNQSYIASNSKVKNEYGTMGHNLIQNARNDAWQVGGMEEIVRLVAQVEPKILKHYESPEFRRRKKHIVSKLRR